MSDISIEPLLNNGVLGVSPQEELGIASNRAAITVDDTAAEVEIGLGLSSMLIQNTGTTIIYFGGSGVLSTTGYIMLPNSAFQFSRVKSTFSIFVICAAGETGTLRVVEFA